MFIPQDWTPTTPEEIAMVSENEEQEEPNWAEEMGRLANAHELNSIEYGESWRSEC